MSLAEWTLFVTSTLIVAFLGFYFFALIVDAFRGDKEARMALLLIFEVAVVLAFIFSFMEVVFS